MKKKILAAVVAAAMCLTCIPAGAMAAGSAKDTAKVNFSAGTPEHFDMVDQSLTVKGNLAETYFPEIKDNEADGVTFADALVAAHIEKYGKDKVKDELEIINGSLGTQVTKQFGHTNVGMYFANDVALAVSVSDAVKDKDVLYAGASEDGNWDFGYAYFNKRMVKTIAGKKFSIAAKYLKTDPVSFETKAAPLNGGEIMSVNKKTGKMTLLGMKINKKGNAKVSVEKAGISYISLAGKEDTGFGESSLAGALVKVTAVPAKTVLKSAKAGKKKATLKWKKAAGAKKYQVYRANKKNGKFKKVVTVKKTSFVNKKLKKGKTYFYKVRAIAKADGKTYKGAFSKVKKVKVK